MVKYRHFRSRNSSTAKMTIREDVYPLYWYFAYERFMIYKRRLEGLPPPWTDDEILRTYKFCNTFRYTDRVSQDLIRLIVLRRGLPHSAAPELSYCDYKSQSERFSCEQPPAVLATTQYISERFGDDVFRVVFFRFFSRTETYLHVCKALGRAPQILDLETDALTHVLDDLAESGQKLYTAAFILCASNRYGHQKKHRNHIELFREMFLQENFSEFALGCKNMKELAERLETFPMIGPFMAYQIANDLCYLPQVNIDPNSFTIAGPGALRGIKKAFVEHNGLTPAEVIQWMRGNQETEFKKYGYDFYEQAGEWLGLVDCQGLFCELDKYCRVFRPDLGSGRARIKQKFRPQNKPTRLKPLGGDLDYFAKA